MTDDNFNNCVIVISHFDVRIFLVIEICSIKYVRCTIFLDFYNPKYCNMYLPQREVPAVSVLPNFVRLSIGGSVSISTVRFQPIWCIQTIGGFQSGAICSISANRSWLVSITIQFRRK